MVSGSPIGEGSSAGDARGADDGASVKVNVAGPLWTVEEGTASVLYRAIDCRKESWHNGGERALSSMAERKV